MVRPFINWAGSKTQLFPKILLRIPAGCSRYVEPFVGGGAVLLEIATYFDEVYISDTNELLIGLYLDVRDHPDALIEMLAKIQKNYLQDSFVEQDIYYQKQQNRFHELVDKPSTERSALFLFFNTYCRNRPYNISRFTRKPEADIDFENILACSSVLQHVDIQCRSFETTLNLINDRTFVYCDPPYRPLSLSASGELTKDGFNDEAQNELARYARRVVQRNGKILLSNSDPHNINPNENFFDNLYNGFCIERVPISRFVTELLIHSEYDTLE